MGQTPIRCYSDGVGAVASSLTSESGSGWVLRKSTWVGGLRPRVGRAVMAQFYCFICLFIFYSFLYYFFGFYRLGMGVGSIGWFNAC